MCFVCASHTAASPPSADELPAPAHRRPLGPQLQDQDQPRHDDACLPLQGRHRCCRRLASNGWLVHRSVLHLGRLCQQPQADSSTFQAAGCCRSGPKRSTYSLTLTCYRTVALASGTVKKVIEINKYLLGTMAGGAGAFCLAGLKLASCPSPSSAGDSARGLVYATSSVRDPSDIECSILAPL